MKLNVSRLQKRWGSSFLQGHPHAGRKRSGEPRWPGRFNSSTYSLSEETVRANLRKWLSRPLSPCTCVPWAQTVRPQCHDLLCRVMRTNGSVQTRVLLSLRAASHINTLFPSLPYRRWKRLLLHLVMLNQDTGTPLTVLQELYHLPQELVEELEECM